MLSQNGIQLLEEQFSGQNLIMLDHSGRPVFGVSGQANFIIAIGGRGVSKPELV